MSNIYSIHHCSVLVADTERALKFYTNVLGMGVEPERPDLGFPGAWLRIGDQQQIHLLELPNPDSTEGRPAHGGRDRHVALNVKDLKSIEDALRAAGVPFTMSKSGRRALFCRDPDGNALEFVERVAL